MKASILDKFPKNRPELPIDIKNIYDKYYRTNRDGSTKATGLAQKMEQWMHHKVASDVTSGLQDNTTLEIGAGTLNHLPYEKTVKIYDVVEPFEPLFENSPNIYRLRTRYKDITDVPTGLMYDRILSIAAFEHICNLPELVARATLLLKNEGCLRIAIPSEGSLLWYLGWRFTTGLEFFIKYKLNYAKLMQFEHVNSWREIKAVLDYFFSEISSKSFGPTPNLSFYQFYECRLPNKKLAKEYLSEASKEQ